MDLSDIDKAAHANLCKLDIKKYFEYKKQLSADNEPEDEQRAILTGFIWDCTESYENENNT